MFEANATVIGNVITHPIKRDLANGEQVVTFRMASNSRRLDYATGEWVDNGTLFLTVSCWRRLVAGVDTSIRRGDPIIAYGQLRSHEYRTKDGAERRDLEMRASTIGPDLSRCTAQVTRRSEPGAWAAAHGVARNTPDRSRAEPPVSAPDDGAGDPTTSASPAAIHTTEPVGVAS